MDIPDIDAITEQDKIEYQWKLMEIRFDYAWKYFDFHAKQRTTMFNFFILFSGVLANAYVLLFNNNYYFLSIFVAFLGVSIAIIFIFIDRRNEELVHIAEDVLLCLEREVLFKDCKCIINWPKRRKLSGSMKFQPTERQIGIFLREEADEIDDGKSIYSHGKWLPRIHIIIALFFLLCCIYSIYCISAIIALLFAICVYCLYIFCLS